MWPRARAAWLEDLLYGVTNPGPDALRLPGPGLVSGESLHVWETGRSGTLSARQALKQDTNAACKHNTCRRSSLSLT